MFRQFWQLAALIGVVFTSLGQNEMDANGKRHGAWSKKFEGTDQVRYTGQFDHGKEVGVFKYYIKNNPEQPTSTIDYSTNPPTASYFTKDGSLIAFGGIRDRKRVGEWVTYHKKSTQVMMRETYDDGALNGKTTTYYPDGKIAETAYYADDLMNGERIVYALDGTVLRKLNYKSGELHGEARYFDPVRKLLIKGNYLNGKKIGLWTESVDGEELSRKRY